MKHFLYLASTSPRRKQLIEQMGLECRVVPIAVDEPMNQKMHAPDLALDLALRKMKACMEQNTPLKGFWILTADTLIALDDEKLGKPADTLEAGEILKKLQGRTHQVITAFSIHSPLSGKICSDYESTDVTFSPMDGSEIEEYLKTEEWKGAAGAYRIQEQGGKYISSIRGSHYNVMGLPINRIYGILRQLNFS